MNQQKKQKIVKIMLSVILYFFLALCIFSVIVTITSKKDVDGAAEFFGYQMRIVVSDSMEKCEFTDVSDYDIKSIPLRSVIFVKKMPTAADEANAWYADIKEGDVLTFRYVYSNQVTITHRVTSITQKEGGYVIELAGDNKNSENSQMYQTIDTSIPENHNYVIGKVVGQSLLLGIVLSILKSVWGIVLIIILPCVGIIVYEVVKIVKVLGSERKKIEAEEKAKKDSELEELRRRIAELESAKVDRKNNTNDQKIDASESSDVATSDKNS